MITKLIFFEKGVETLTYFSHALASALEQQGFRTFFYDISKEGASLKHVKRYIKAGETAVVTFNFIGLSGESFLQETHGISIWESFGLPVYCIVVDHPLYYQKQLECGVKASHVLC